MDYRAHPAIHRCVDALSNGDVIAYPTEAVWGLGCDPFNQHAVDKVLWLKRRKPEKGLIIVAASMAQIQWLLQGITPAQEQQLSASWPGPNTWLIPHHGRIPANVCGQHATIAVRVSSHPVVRALCHAYGGPIVSTSANPQALKPARDATQVRHYFRDSVYYAPGRVGGNPTPSVIRDLRSGQTIRP
ncbi:L-threonylcarbamoyladenylate synthase [Teredinibacter turnerae]|uniref:L-threonylcarbamoyladenylate synthase n=1 Tax=Teredinibacter turnerae TaxID=2426 RepID=UPI0003659B2A|nr:Sua5/YciO/YrdC/YwlC family protein [Teredinibacter turnerae]